MRKVYIKDLSTDDIYTCNGLERAGDMLGITVSMVRRHVEDSRQPIKDLRYMLSYIKAFRDVEDPIIDINKLSKDSPTIVVKKETTELYCFIHSKDVAKLLKTKPKIIEDLKNSKREHTMYDFYSYKDFIKVYHYIDWKDVLPLFYRKHNKVTTKVIKKYMPRDIPK